MKQAVATVAAARPAFPRGAGELRVTGGWGIRHGSPATRGLGTNSRQGDNHESDRPAEHCKAAAMAAEVESEAENETLIASDNEADTGASVRKVVLALEHYRELHGHCNVQPSQFRVPESGGGWPAETRGFALGAAIRYFRWANNAERLPEAKRAALDRAGFVWDVYEWRWAELVLPALRHWTSIHGTASFPKVHDTIPTNPNDPHWGGTPFAGLKLGVYCQHIRLGQTRRPLPPWIHAAVADLGLPVVTLADDQQWHRTAELLSIHVDVHGTAIVGQDFVVPASPPWPADAHGAPLGEYIRLCRRNRRFMDTESVARLDRAGMVWNLQRAEWAQAIEVLSRWRTLHHTYPPPDATVPFDPQWSPQLHGFPVGKFVRRLRTGRHGPKWVREAYPEIVRGVQAQPPAIDEEATP